MRRMKFSMRVGRLYAMIVVFAAAIIGCSVLLHPLFVPYYTEHLDLSDFEEFCLQRHATAPEHVLLEENLDKFYEITDVVHEATVTRQDDGTYVAQLRILQRFDEREPVVEDLAPQLLTTAQTERMLDIFSDFHVDPTAGPYCIDPRAGDFIVDYDLRWDDLWLSVNDCDHPRLRPTEAYDIASFIAGLREDD